MNMHERLHRYFGNFRECGVIGDKYFGNIDVILIWPVVDLVQTRLRPRLAWLLPCNTHRCSDMEHADAGILQCDFSVDI